MYDKVPLLYCFYFRIEKGSPKITVLHTRNLDLAENGLIVDLHHFDTGSQSVLAYATVHGSLIGWDLRAPKVAWHLKNDPKLGKSMQMPFLSMI